MKTGFLFLVALSLAANARAGSGEPPPDAVAEAPYYFYDYVNKPFPLYPEPIWRQMFPSLHERIEAERRAFGVPGQSARELDYHIKAWRQQRARTVRAVGASK